MNRRTGLIFVGLSCAAAVLLTANPAARATDEQRLVGVLFDAGRPLEERGEAAETLANLGWRPATERERAWHLVAIRDWQGAVAAGSSAVEPLTSALRDADPAARGGAAAALGDLGAAAGELVAALGDPHPLVRRNAARSLARLGPAVTAPLFALAVDARAPSRWEAAAVLAVRGEPRVVEVLTAAVSDRALAARERARAAEALARAGGVLDGPARIDFLIALGDWGNPALRGDPRAVEPLIEALADPDGLVRRSAAGTLGAIRDPRALGPLVSLLGDRETMVRDVAVRALGALGDQRARDPLVAVLRDPATGRSTRELLEKTLAALGWQASDAGDQARVLAARGDWARVAALGEPAVDVLVPLLASAHLTVRREAANALGTIRSPRSAPALVALLEDEDYHVAKAAATALGRIGDRSVVAAILPLLDSPRAGTLEPAIIALGDLGDARAVEPLARLLARRDLSASKAPAALGKIGAAEGVEPLLRFIDGNHNFVGYSIMRDDAVEALALIGKPALEPVLASFSGDNAPSRREKARILGRIGDTRALPVLLAYLPKADAMARKDVVVALGAIGDPSAVEALLPFAREGETTLRIAATTALGAIDDPRAVDALRSLAGDTNAGVRAAAMKALEHRGAR